MFIFLSCIIDWWARNCYALRSLAMSCATDLDIFFLPPRPFKLLKMLVNRSCSFSRAELAALFENCCMTTCPLTSDDIAANGVYLSTSTAWPRYFKCAFNLVRLKFCSVVILIGLLRLSLAAVYNFSLKLGSLRARSSIAGYCPMDSIRLPVASLSLAYGVNFSCIRCYNIELRS